MTCRVPAHLVAQIIHGQLIILPRPAPKHARASSIMGGKSVPSYDEGSNGAGGWWILDEPELHLGSDILVPDLAGWQRERMLALPEKAYFDLAPDWVCEVLSPATAQMDRVDKLPLYAAQAVGDAWLVDPTRKPSRSTLCTNAAGGSSAPSRRRKRFRRHLSRRSVSA